MEEKIIELDDLYEETDRKYIKVDKISHFIIIIFITSYFQIRVTLFLTQTKALHQEVLAIMQYLTLFLQARLKPKLYIYYN